LRERGHVPQVDLRSALAAQLVVRLGKRIRGRICWRSSMYDIEGFFTNNPINRYGIGNMAEKLQPDADGGLMITIQHESPDKDREAKWLPAPAEAVFMAMRLYQPKERMYRGDYIVAPVRKMK
jgi:hypothetical protein